MCIRKCLGVSTQKYKVAVCIVLVVVKNLK